MDSINQLKGGVLVAGLLWLSHPISLAMGYPQDMFAEHITPERNVASSVHVGKCNLAAFQKMQHPPRSSATQRKRTIHSPDSSKLANECLTCLISGYRQSIRTWFGCLLNC